MYAFPQENDKIQVSLGRAHTFAETGFKVSLCMESKMYASPSENDKIQVSLGHSHGEE